MACSYAGIVYIFIDFLLAICNINMVHKHGLVLHSSNMMALHGV